MERPKSRKGQYNRRFPCDALNFSSNEKDVICNDKIKYKKHFHCDKKKYEISPNSYFTNVPAQARMHSFGQRPFSTSESSVCHYSVPLSFSFEPVSLPIYSALIQPQGNCAIPLEMESHFNNRTKHHRTHSKNRRSKTNSVNEVPAIFNTSRINNGDQHDYTSLPPVNCDVYASKSNESDAVCKRRFSDPGLGQMSSDDCSTARSDVSSKSSSVAEVSSQDLFAFMEQMNELKESNSQLMKELHEAKLELEALKINSQTWSSNADELKPGALSDAINEIRNAVKLGEEALISKVIQMLEKNASECKEVQANMELKLRKEMNERLGKLEEQMKQVLEKDGISDIVTVSEMSESSVKDDMAIHQQLVKLEQEKLQLRKELQEAVAKRKSAEATTERLERLVGVLRKKINGVSLESCMPEEKQNIVRPLASSFEKNPFIMANNRQGQKSESPIFQKPKISPFRPFSQDNPEVTSYEENENKENETGESAGIDGNSNNLSPQAQSDVAITAQVTITGPVTDL